MSEAERLNRILEREAPALARCLSPLGRAAAFPRGIPFQSAQARGTRLNATIGQLTNGFGAPLPLPSLEEATAMLDPVGTFLYPPVAGPPALCAAWQARQKRIAGATVATSQSLVTHGLTHALSLCADLFVGPETTVILPDLCWENYELVFGMRTGVSPVTFPLHRDGRFDPSGLAEALAGVTGPAVVVLNFPSNPGGYMPDAAEREALIAALVAHPGPAVVLVDDAYQGIVHEPGIPERSLFWDLAERADPGRLAAIKVDGATKELLFFGSRVGFITSTATGDADAALMSKWTCVIRGTVGAASGPALQLVARALASPDLEEAIAARRAIITERYRALRGAVTAHADSGIVPFPFNAAFFALFRLPDGVDADAVRRRLIDEESVGVVAAPAFNALRVAYCSTDVSTIEPLVEAIARVVRRG